MRTLFHERGPLSCGFSLLPFLDYLLPFVFLAVLLLGSVLQHSLKSQDSGLISILDSFLDNFVEHWMVDCRQFKSVPIFLCRSLLLGYIVLFAEILDICPPDISVLPGFESEKGLCVVQSNIRETLEWTTRHFFRL